MEQNVQTIAMDAFERGIYKKNIHYIYKSGADIQEFLMVKLLGGSPGQSSWMIQQAYHKVGIQMQVSQQVSNDLLATDFSHAAKLTNVPWPAPVIEFYFEDPKLPTILLMKITPKELGQWFPGIEIGLQSEEYITGLMQEGSDVETAKQLSVQLKPDMYDRFLHTGESAEMETSFFSHQLTKEDNCTMAFMVNLAIKVLAFASIPKFKPAPIVPRQMHHGGKPDVKGRPKRPSYQVLYLPKVIHERIQHESLKEQHDFRGRRGHIRWYMHERFVHLRGEWDLIPPVADPHTGKYPERKLIRVRKPNE